MTISQREPANQHLFTVTLANRVLTILVDCPTIPWVCQRNDASILTIKNPVNCLTWLAKHHYSNEVH